MPKKTETAAKKLAAYRETVHHLDTPAPKRPVEVQQKYDGLLRMRYRRERGKHR